MGLTAKEQTGEVQKVPEGVHHAICIGVFDLGTKHDEKWDKDTHKILIMWELPHERITIDDQEKPMAISKEYTLSLHEKSQLRKDLEAWRGRAFTKEELSGFDLTNILGANCQLQVVHKEASNGKVYANISAIMSLPKGTTILTAENEHKKFSFEEYSPDDSLPESIPKWIRQKIEQSIEYQNINFVDEWEK